MLPAPRVQQERRRLRQVLAIDGEGQPLPGPVPSHPLLHLLARGRRLRCLEEHEQHLGVDGEVHPARGPEAPLVTAVVEEQRRVTRYPPAKEELGAGTTWVDEEVVRRRVEAGGQHHQVGAKPRLRARLQPSPPPVPGQPGMSGAGELHLQTVACPGPGLAMKIRHPPLANRLQEVAVAARVLHTVQREARHQHVQLPVEASLEQPLRQGAQGALRQGGQHRQGDVHRGVARHHPPVTPREHDDVARAARERPLHGLHGRRPTPDDDDAPIAHRHPVEP